MGGVGGWHICHTTIPGYVAGKGRDEEEGGGGVKSDLIFYPGGEGGQPPITAVRPEQVQREVIPYFYPYIFYLIIFVYDTL